MSLLPANTAAIVVPTVSSRPQELPISSSNREMARLDSVIPLIRAPANPFARRRWGGGHVPTISRFFGILIQMYLDDHPPPHFHAIYG